MGTPNEAETAVGSKIVSLAFAVHPFPSVIVTDINPADKLVIYLREVKEVVTIL